MADKLPQTRFLDTSIPHWERHPNDIPPNKDKPRIKYIRTDEGKSVERKVNENGIVTFKHVDVPFEEREYEPYFVGYGEAARAKRAKREAIKRVDAEVAAS